MTHKNIVTTMLSHRDSAQRFRLHGDIILDDLENDYRVITGEDINVTRLDGGSVYRVGESTYYTGAMTRHPSTRAYEVIAG